MDFLNKTAYNELILAQEDTVYFMIAKDWYHVLDIIQTELWDGRIPEDCA